VSTTQSWLVKRHHDFIRWLYRDGRPNLVARVLNRGQAIAHSAGIYPRRLGTLEVPGRRTGHIISFPVVIADYEGGRYLVSMLGEHANWVGNVRAAGGGAVLRHGRREAVHLEAVAPEDRPPILRRYLECAPGARPHIPVDRHAAVDEFKRIAPQIPVLRIQTEPEQTASPAGHQERSSPLTNWEVVGRRTDLTRRETASEATRAGCPTGSTSPT
jgi:hypothetical protein